MGRAKTSLIREQETPATVQAKYRNAAVKWLAFLRIREFWVQISARLRLPRVIFCFLFLCSSVKTTGQKLKLNH